jgi:hypothetical protein
MNVIRTKTPISIPGARLVRRAYLTWRLAHAEADEKAYRDQSKVCSKEAERLRVEIAQLTD